MTKDSHREELPDSTLAGEHSKEVSKWSKKENRARYDGNFLSAWKSYRHAGKKAKFFCTESKVI